MASKLNLLNGGVLSLTNFALFASTINMLGKGEKSWIDLVIFCVCVASYRMKKWHLTSHKNQMTELDSRFKAIDDSISHLKSVLTLKR